MIAGDSISESLPPTSQVYLCITTDARTHSYRPSNLIWEKALDLSDAKVLPCSLTPLNPQFFRGLCSTPRKMQNDIQPNQHEEFADSHPPYQQSRGDLGTERELSCRHLRSLYTSVLSSPNMNDAIPRAGCTSSRRSATTDD